MDVEKHNLLTPTQVTFMLTGFTMGIGILGLPNSLVKDSYQDAWIAALLGAAYPLYIGILAIYVSSKYPKDTVLTLSKKLCGKFIGTILNIIFLTFFIFHTVVTIAGFNNIVRVYAVPFLTSSKVLAISLLAIAYTTYKGLKVVGKVSEIGSYFMLLVILTSLAALRKGSLQNLFPFFQASIVDILKSTKQSMFSYSGIEAIFLIYPFINDSKKLKRSILSFIGITALIYTYVTFISIYYLSVDAIPKGIWSFALVTESFVFPVINNFRFIFIFIWTIVALRLSANYYYGAVFVLNNLFQKLSEKKITLLLYPVTVFLSLMLTNETVRSKFIDLLIFKYTIFNALYISLISLLVYLKRNGKS
ncbi:GerAB/ArcD/ProY family transporter [Clostridium sp. A1-XYC3]|uniref:GerAB/ArcD/ProY family transporter n=1 Tax=Clostridium tanneri TaxID=3037988 RepID=A0ABU4JY66_9CLOT|nr:GerAB/ArcD/ProY family transporter [Clostridium sp. A1-XYC3]MDW8802814.1 GerAB/ArcD/ProY family transporter [Clostridium sp. A1-XYC3]